MIYYLTVVQWPLVGLPAEAVGDEGQKRCNKGVEKPQQH